MEDSISELGVLLNSEGPLLKVGSRINGAIIVEAYSNEYEGNLLFEPKFKDLVSYIESKITLRELIFLSKSQMFSFNLNVEMKRIPLETIIDSLFYIDQYYNEVPEDLK